MVHKLSNLQLTTANCIEQKRQPTSGPLIADKRKAFDETFHRAIIAAAHTKTTSFYYHETDFLLSSSRIKSLPTSSSERRMEANTAIKADDDGDVR